MTEISENDAVLLTILSQSHDKMNLKALAERSGLDGSAVMRSALSLSERGLVSMEKKTFNLYRTTEEGAKYARAGLPEHQVVEMTIQKGGRAFLDDVVKALNIDTAFIPVILGWMKRKSLARIGKSQERIVIETPTRAREKPDEELLRDIQSRKEVIEEEFTPKERDLIEILKRRNLVLAEPKTERTITLTEKGRDEVKRGLQAEQTVSQLTSQDIATGRWRSLRLRRYNIQAPVQATWPGKVQPYNQFLDELKRRLVALGFQEMTGPTVEYMFFNCDALFMPQDHPAREIHDMFFLKDPRYGDLTRYREYLLNVKEAHENGWKTGSRGWGYIFNTEESGRLILRSHGTAISARTLISKELKIPGKYFSIARCYRPEVTDRTHLSEFNQVEGIVVGKDLTLRDLLGVLERFAREIAHADKVRFKPDYFPFTEPSIELQAYKEGYGWLEFGGSGIFRPELTLPLGITVPVLAWGLGVDRLYMMKASIEDIRDLFTQDIQWLRTKEVF